MTGLRLGQVPDFERFPLLGERADEVLTLVATRAKLGTSQQILLVFLLPDSPEGARSTGVSPESFSRHVLGKPS